MENGKYINEEEGFKLYFFETDALSQEDSEIVEEIDDELYIVDEAHRGASADWGEKLKKLILSYIKKKTSKTTKKSVANFTQREYENLNQFYTKKTISIQPMIFCNFSYFYSTLSL